jgi:hypothetical protein
METILGAAAVVLFIVYAFYQAKVGYDAVRKGNSDDPFNGTRNRSSVR